MVGERLRAARLMAGMSQSELAEAAGVSTMAISKYERGIIRPSTRVLLELGEALDRKVEYFLRPIQVKVEGALHRARAGRARRDQEAVNARVAECIERYLAAEAILNLSASFEMPKLKPWDGTLGDAERVAEALRVEWELGMGPIPNLIDVLEDRGIRVCTVEGDRRFDALLVFLEDKTPVMAVKGNDVPGDRFRFSLAHELGHLVLQHEPEPSREDDKAADRFAGAFLVPRKTVERELATWGPKRPIGFLIHLKQEYGLSPQAWVYRAGQLGIITEAECRQIWRRMGGRRVKEIGEPYPLEQPRRMIHLVYAALVNDAISKRRAAELLAVSITDVARESIDECTAAAVCG